VLNPSFYAIYSRLDILSGTESDTVLVCRDCRDILVVLILGTGTCVLRLKKGIDTKNDARNYFYSQFRMLYEYERTVAEVLSSCSISRESNGQSYHTPAATDSYIMSKS
jgi:hypothetical protein